MRADIRPYFSGTPGHRRGFFLECDMKRSAGTALCLLFFLSGAMTAAAEGSLLQIEMEFASSGSRITLALLGA